MRATFQIVLGGIIGIFLLLFFMANDDWVTIRMPSVPWHSSPSWPAYEARLFAVFLVSFVLGGGVFAFVAALMTRRRQQIHKVQQQRIEALEKELEKEAEVPYLPKSHEPAGSSL